MNHELEAFRKDIYQGRVYGVWKHGEAYLVKTAPGVLDMHAKIFDSIRSCLHVIVALLSIPRSAIDKSCLPSVFTLPTMCETFLYLLLSHTSVSLTQARQVNRLIITASPATRRVASQLQIQIVVTCLGGLAH
jgi:hypothetical protein